MALFYDEYSHKAAAKRLCRGCDVQQECLDDALEREEEFGVWGGHDTRERRTILRLRRKAAVRQAELERQKAPDLPLRREPGAFIPFWISTVPTAPDDRSGPAESVPPWPART